MSETRAIFAYPRLCLAYFLQFAIWGSWAGALGGYAEVIKLKGPEIGWLFAAIPLGAVISPLFIGPIADRYFSAQKVVSFLHFIGALCLILCGLLCEWGIHAFAPLMTLILLSGICFMPTIALMNSIVFKHSPSGTAPYVFVFGTFGWIVVNLIIATFLGGAEKPYFFFAGGGAGLLLSLYALTLPDTPPKGAPAAGEKSDALGLGALKLFKDPGFALFVACAFFASIPACNFYFPFQVPFLTQHGYPSPVALTTLNQFSELIFMSLLPIAIAFIGLKWVLVLGIGSWTLRYLLFSLSTFETSIIALLLHGFAYSFLYVAAYTYADKKAPPELKASVQSLMAFLLLGVAQVLGSLWYGQVKDWPENVPMVADATVVRPLNAEEIDDYAKKFTLPEGTPENFWQDVKFHASEPLPPWNDITAGDTAWRYLDLAKTVAEWRGQKSLPFSDLGSLLDTNKDNVITAAEIAAGPEILYFGEEIPSGEGAVETAVETRKPYAREDIDRLMRKIAAAKIAKEQNKSLAEVEQVTGDYTVDRKDYLTAQSSNWKGILYPPMIWITVFFVLFALFGRNPKDEAAPETQAA